MDTKTLADKLKSAPTATSLSGLSTLLCDSSGNPLKTSPQELAAQIFITKECGDIDSLLTPGLYKLMNTSTGTFPGGFARCRWAIVEVFLRGTDVYQRLTETTFMAVRRCDVSNVIWGIWMETVFAASAT